MFSLYYAEKVDKKFKFLKYNILGDFNLYMDVFKFVVLTYKKENMYIDENDNYYVVNYFENNFRYEYKIIKLHINKLEFGDVIYSKVIYENKIKTSDIKFIYNQSNEKYPYITIKNFFINYSTIY
jgi:hypothetical protein